MIGSRRLGEAVGIRDGLGVAGAALVLVFACGCSSSAPTAPVETAAAAAVQTVPSPSAEQSVQLLATLGGIDEGLNNDRSIGRARNVCSDILAGEFDDATITDRAKTRFEGGTVPSLSADQMAKIINTVRTTFCAAG